MRLVVILSKINSYPIAQGDLWAAKSDAKPGMVGAARIRERSEEEIITQANGVTERGEEKILSEIKNGSGRTQFLLKDRD